jgi:hypothetical protein
VHRSLRGRDVLDGIPTQARPSRPRNIKLVVSDANEGHQGYRRQRLRVIGSIVLELNDEWAVQRACYTTHGNHETIARLSDDPTVSLPAIAG